MQFLLEQLYFFTFNSSLGLLVYGKARNDIVCDKLFASF